jgi:hypothetical protein
MPFLVTASALWGMVYAGNFFLRSIMSDVIDYDQFLSGKRREAQYMMTLTFLPKFLEVPAEALPFLLMAYLGYKRPEDDGVLPVQPAGVVWLVRLCVSVVPAAFIIAGALVLRYFPAHARSGKSHEELIVAIHEKHSKGLPAEDPWFPGSIMGPPPAPGPNDDVLSYFWPSELKIAFEQESDNAAFSSLWWRTLRGIVIGLCLFPCGVTLIALGWKDMNSDLGASVSPIGLIFVGVAILLSVFDMTRLLAVKEVGKRCVPRDEMASRYNFLCRFTGSSPALGLVPLPASSAAFANSPKSAEEVSAFTC